MKRVLTIILCLFYLFAAFSFVGCGKNTVSAPVLTIGDNGHWYIDGKDTGIFAKGEKGDKGDKGDTGEKGEKGDKGDSSIGPKWSIGENGNWFLDGTDTGIKAQTDSSSNSSFEPDPEPDPEPVLRERNALYIASSPLEGNFNPFYGTSAADKNVIGMTQLKMLSIDSNGAITAGDYEPTVVKAFSYEKNNEGNTVYKFVIKNNLKFSDGKPLTMNDVMFNIYEYLDPIYTGSNALCSTKILGLNAYRTQTEGADEDYDSGELSAASAMAYNRRLALELIYTTEAEKGDNSYDADETSMKEILGRVEIPSLYMAAFNYSLENEAAYRAKLIEDYNFACETFKKEIENDYKSAKESFDLTSSLYKPHAAKLENDVYKFFVFEGYITPVYAKKDGKDDKSNIERFENEDYATRYDTMEKAINFVYSSKIRYNFNQVITYWGTASTMLTRFEGDARSIILQDKKGTISNISGIVSLGHTGTDSEVVVAAGNGKTVGGDLGTYKIAKIHNVDGTPVNSNEYDVLQITVKGEDPKAIYNFGFTVAPQHYYATDDNGTCEEVDISNNKFGLKFADSDFQTNVIQSQRHVSIPVGAGPYMVSNKENKDEVVNSEFFKDDIVYFKANENFMFEVKNKKLRLRVINSSDAIEALANGEVDYITPQLTNENYAALKNLYNDGIKTAQGWQLGYGYVGINAGKVPNIYVRRAIMAAMNRSLVKDYYPEDAVTTIDWPMSKVSWAYPKVNEDYTVDELPDWTQWQSENIAKSTIQNLMARAEMSGATQEDYRITFTIPGASVSEHPAYQVFVKAAEILNSLGWKIEIKADSSALTKLATGSLAVWAGDWDSTIDPDMYEKYHKNSSSASVYAWGYREIFGDQTKYAEEVSIINRLSEKIEAGRETTDQESRKAIYKNAMIDVFNLAVEMPIYQRMNLYAFNTKVIMESSLKYSTTADGNVNPYSSPLERIWEIELLK